MSIRTGIIYASVDGQTKKICSRLAEIIKEQGHAVEVFTIDCLPANMDHLEKVIIASSIRYGKHNEAIQAFINDHTDELNHKKAAFVSVNLVARKAEKASAETNPYVIKFLKTIQWVPGKVGVFAGCLDYSKYTFFDKLMIRFIMVLTKGPVRSKEAIEYTDWQKVKEFAHSFSAW